MDFTTGVPAEFEDLIEDALTAVKDDARSVYSLPARRVALVVMDGVSTVLVLMKNPCYTGWPRKNATVDTVDFQDFN